MHDAIADAWRTVPNVLAVMPTGAGKTVTFAHIVHEESNASVVLAHRAELVAQISLALARERVRHRIVGPSALIRLCVAGHMAELGQSFYNANAKCAAGSVQSIAGYKNPEWFPQVKLWVHDEAHHLLKDNQFGKAVAKFPNARGLGVTATPGRTDGKGLGRKWDGVMDEMILGPSPRELIKAGYLSKYKIFAPPSTLDRSKVHVTPSGEFSAPELKAATALSSVLGDVVEHYCKHAPGKSGLTFADSIDNAVDIAARFRAAGVAAEVLTGKTPDGLRAHVLRQFKLREIQQIVSVQLIDEGFDCPGVEVVSDGAATESFGRFAQRFGRGLRLMDGKEHMTYFDHVGNTIRHGLPDAPREWSLLRRERATRGPNDAIPLTTCLNPGCNQPYERIYRACPHCGFYSEPAQRSAPQYVDGDLMELDESVLAALRGEVERVDGACYVPQAMRGTPAEAALRSNHADRQNKQHDLRNCIAWWAGLQIAQGRSESESYRRFYFKFGIDVVGSLALNAKDAAELAGRITAELAKDGIDTALSTGVFNWSMRHA